MDQLGAAGSRPVFLCHSAIDAEVARRICDAIEFDGIECWIAPRDVLPGTTWSEAILDAIEVCRVLVLLLSTHSNASPQVLREVERAVAKHKTILTIRLDESPPTRSLEYFLSSQHWVNASADNATASVSAYVRQLLELDATRPRDAGEPPATPRQTRRWWWAGAATVALAAAWVTWLAQPGPLPSSETLNVRAVLIAALERLSMRRQNLNREFSDSAIRAAFAPAMESRGESPIRALGYFATIARERSNWLGSQLEGLRIADDEFAAVVTRGCRSTADGEFAKALFEDLQRLDEITDALRLQLTSIADLVSGQIESDAISGPAEPEGEVTSTGELAALVPVLACGLRLFSLQVRALDTQIEVANASSVTLMGRIAGGEGAAAALPADRFEHLTFRAHMDEDALSVVRGNAKRRFQLIADEISANERSLPRTEVFLLRFAKARQRAMESLMNAMNQSHSAMLNSVRRIV